MQKRDTFYVDTPNGIFTEAGVWFQSSEAMITEYAAGVVAREPLPRLLRQAEVWTRSHQAFTLWALPLLLWLISPLPAMLSALTIYIGWRVLAPGLVSRLAISVARILDFVWLQGLYYVFMLSFLSAQGAWIAVVIGVAGFVLIRWGVLERITYPAVRPMWRSLYAMPIPDQILRSVIIRAALKHRVSLPEIDRMERRIMNNLNRDR
jgi:hypothetical protein